MLMDEELMLQGLKQFMFDHDWFDTDVVALLEDEDIPYINEKEFTYDKED
jgi:hypothetical protein